VSAHRVSNIESERWLMTAFAFGAGPVQVDTEAGIIRGVAIVTEGEAKGHGVNLDSEFIERAATLGNQKEKQGLKVRFGHPAMSNTALGTFLGRAKDFRTEKLGDGRAVTRADYHLSKLAQDTPKGDLYSYVLKMAKENPDMFGNSIVFTPGKTYVRDDKGAKVYDYEDYDKRTGFYFTKPEYKDKPVFIEMEELHASDMVDDPAAHPSGLFSAWQDQTFAGQMTEFLDTHPEILALVDGNPQIIPAFLGRYNAYRERKNQRTVILTETDQPKDKHMSDKVTAPATAAPPAPAAPVVEAAKVDPRAEFNKELNRFRARFGDSNGAKWFGEGKTYEQAQDAHIEELAAQNKALQAQIDEANQKLGAVKRGVKEPAAFQDGEESGKKKTNLKGVDRMAAYHKAQREAGANGKGN
jgi:hypothetical protein